MAIAAVFRVGVSAKSVGAFPSPRKRVRGNRSDGALVEGPPAPMQPSSDSPSASGPHAVAGPWGAREHVLRFGALFAIGVVPLLFVETPPLQDVPNHLATLAVMKSPALYPEFVVNGLLKTNAAFFAWMLAVSKFVSVFAALKLFVVLIAAAGAFAYPRAVDALAGPAVGRSASLFLFPFVHNFFVCAGMLDFALGVPLALELLLAVQRFRSSPSPLRAAAVTALSLVVWYAHVFALLVAGLLATIEFVREAVLARRIRPLALLLPLAPAGLLALRACLGQIGDQSGGLAVNGAATVFLAPWELVYSLWAEWAWAFTWRTAASAIVVVPLVWGLRRWRASTPFFSVPALVVLGAAFCFSPYTAASWGYFNTRFVPFLWLALLVRMPPRVPRWLAFTALVSALSYAAGLVVEYRALDRDRREFIAAMDAVPEQAALLPLVFDAKGASENTRPMLHAWGYYVLEKRTAAPLLFAYSRAYPVYYREAPPEQLNAGLLELVGQNLGDKRAVCTMLKRSGAAENCGELYAEFWRQFWGVAAPRFTHVLLWGAPVDALSMMPAEYTEQFSRGKLKLFVRASRESDRRR